MSAIEELITRLEAAAEGSREIDVAIWDAVEHWPVADDPAWRHAPNGADVHALTFAPYYTTSLDAALCGEDIEMMSIQRPRPDQPPRWCAKDAKAKEAGYGWTEPLARRIAALKGRAA